MDEQKVKDMLMEINQKVSELHRYISGDCSVLFIESKTSVSDKLERNIRVTAVETSCPIVYVEKKNQIF